MAGKIKIGGKYGNWTVTQYEPLTYDSLGAPFGGTIKLVNQKNHDTVLVQHDHALRAAKWWVSYDGHGIEDKTPIKVIDKLVKLKENKDMTTLTRELIQQMIKEELLVESGASSQIQHILNLLDKTLRKDKFKHVATAASDKHAVTVYQTLGGEKYQITVKPKQ